MEKTFNIDIHGGNNQNVFGDGATVTQNNSVGGSVHVEINRLLKDFEASVPAELHAELQAEVLQPLQALAEVKVPEEDLKDEAKAEQAKKTLWERSKEIAANAAKFLPYLKKPAAAFALGALKTIPPPISWAVGGFLEVARFYESE